MLKKLEMIYMIKKICTNSKGNEESKMNKRTISIKKKILRISTG